MATRSEIKKDKGELLVALAGHPINHAMPKAATDGTHGEGATAVCDNSRRAGISVGVHNLLELCDCSCRR